MNRVAGLLVGFLMAAMGSCYATTFAYDSIGTTKKAGKTFIIHQVDEGETLFSLSRRYGASVALISQENPEAEGGLKIGQKLLIPVVKKEKKNTSGLVHKVKPSETLYSISRQYNVSTEDIKKWNKLSDNTISVGQELLIKGTGTPTAAVEATKADVDYSGKKTHTVAASETLFSISRQHNVSVDDLKKWNGLAGNDLSIGQVLIVSSGIKSAVTSNSSMLPVAVEETKETVEETKETVGETKETVEASTEAVIDVSEIKTPEMAVGPGTANQTMDSKKIIEDGFAQVIEGSSETKKYLALHRSAPVGTIMQVRNKMNNQTVFVRVVGVLPNTGDNNKVLLKISKKAFDRLGAVDTKFPVEISYVP